MNAWVATDYKLGGLQPVGASVTNQVISKQFGITAGGAKNIVIAIRASSVTSSAGITAKLQTGVDQVFQDSKTVAIAANGSVYIKLNVETAGDQTYLPLLPIGQLVITTGAGDAVTIDAVNVIQEL